MKKIILPFLFISISAFAQNTKEVVKQLESLQSVGDQTKAPCTTCEVSRLGSGQNIYTPEQALADINAGELQFLGRDLFPGSDSNRTCVFKSSRAYVLYNNCMGNKSEAPATDIEVISFEGGLGRFYVEHFGSGAISAIPRSSYKGTFTLNFIPTESVGTMNISQLKAFKTKYDTSTNDGCWIGSPSGAQDMQSKASCYGKSKQALSAWNPSAEAFWKNPGSNWQPTLLKLRQTIIKTKY